jgi:hypothetical protein
LKCWRFLALPGGLDGLVVRLGLHGDLAGGLG